MQIPKEVTGILIEMGIQTLKILKDLNEKDQIFKPQKPYKLKPKKGTKHDDIAKPADKESPDFPD